MATHHALDSLKAELKTLIQEGFNTYKAQQQQAQEEKNELKAEVEALQKENKDLKTVLQVGKEARVKLEEENKKLKAALEAVEQAKEKAKVEVEKGVKHPTHLDGDSTSVHEWKLVELQERLEAYEARNNWMLAITTAPLGADLEEVLRDFRKQGLGNQ